MVRRNIPQGYLAIFVVDEAALRRQEDDAMGGGLRCTGSLPKGNGGRGAGCRTAARTYRTIYANHQREAIFIPSMSQLAARSPCATLSLWALT